ncbi:MAG TPA: BlaI/MecI/CopY family transcriptional regulator, partial [Prolixibacteraceae bacterium]|nr:BlaI/MecI/CopY family transcriptional regulator [Prolixibacteraceae bacterium]
KQVHDELASTKDVGYTTTLKIMQNMHAKELLSRKPEGKGHVYFPAFEKEKTRGDLLDRFLESTFSGSASSLVMQLLGNRKTSRKDLEEIKQIIRQMENETKLEP